MKFAVCVLIQNQNGQYLAVSRRNDLTQWGFPGGKVDPGETNLHAIVREVKEETGIILQSDQLIPLYSGMCFGKDGNHFWTTTYLYSSLIDEVDPTQSEEGIAIKFLEQEDMTNFQICPFADYNIQVQLTFDHMSDFW